MKRRSFLKRLAIAIATTPVAIDIIFNNTLVESSIQKISVRHLSEYLSKSKELSDFATSLYYTDDKGNFPLSILTEGLKDYHKTKNYNET